MSGNKFVLDTNAVLYILGGDETLSDFLFGKELYISIISELELLSFKTISIKEEKQILSFLEELTIINISEKIKTLAIELRKSSNLKMPDSIIAATAIALQLPFVTSDKQFQTIPQLNLVYYEK